MAAHLLHSSFTHHAIAPQKMQKEVNVLAHYYKVEFESKLTKKNQIDLRHFPMYLTSYSIVFGILSFDELLQERH